MAALRPIAPVTSTIFALVFQPAMIAPDPPVRLSLRDDLRVPRQFSGDGFSIEAVAHYAFRTCPWALGLLCVREVRSSPRTNRPRGSLELRSGV